MFNHILFACHLAYVCYQCSTQVVATSLSTTLPSASLTLGVPPGWLSTAGRSRLVVVKVVPIVAIYNLVIFFWAFLNFTWTSI